MPADAQPDSSRRSAFLAAVVAIAATYGYFLVFAEFALLELARPLFGDEFALRPLLTVLGASGVAGGFLAARQFQLARFCRGLAAGFAGCAMSAIAALAVGRPGMWVVVAGVGLSLGWTTVTLSSGLRAVVGVRRLGLCCGLGTGLAYALANLPAVFATTPAFQTSAAIGFALVGLVATGWMRSGVVDATAGDRRGGWRWGAIFLALVWLDSAGFYILQHTPNLRAQTWSGAWILYGNAGTHLVGAILAGIALDAGLIGATAAVAVVALAAADFIIGGSGETIAGARVLYTVGVSAYSVALVYYPACRARPWLAAGIFAVSGWIGSALGIGMAQDLHAIPPWFVGLAVLVVFSALVAHRRTAATAAALGCVVVLGLTSPPARADDEMIGRGREIYIAEGCITCHSQYLRPGVPQEILWWGPVRPLAESLAETPPLLGLRRQGPDLMNVGNRRSPEWQRLHLMAPRALAPGSRMPSYAHLFRPGDARGESLVAYLASLGAETLAVRMDAATAWMPSAEALMQPYPESRAQKTFSQLCAACHGPEAHGDGPLAASLSIKPPDFSRDPWRRISADEPNRLFALARIIKFGVPGTPMAGHEYLDDATVIALARLLEGRHR